MTLDTKLRHAAEAVRNATRQAEFTTEAPGSTRRQLAGPAIASIAGLAILVLLGVPALMVRIGSLPTSQGVASQPAGDPPQSGDVAGAFPHLVLDIPDTNPIDAYDITDSETGERVGTHIVYHQTWNNESGETLGREILLHVQAAGQDYRQFTDLVALAESTETARTAGRDVTIYVVPDEAIEEGNYDLGVLHWIEAPGIEAILIPWGLDREGALNLMAGLQRIEPDAWLELTTVHTDPTATTVVVPVPANESTPPTTAAGLENSEPDGR
ncbi:MAG: hypothetical protein ACRDVL_01250 [Acidimicrobiia bacterium]